MDSEKYQYVLPAGTVLKAHFKNHETGKWEDRSYTIEQVVNGHPLPKGQKIRPDDDVRPVLGQGGFGITYLASYLHKDQNNVFKIYYAIKEFFLKEHCWRDEGSTVMRYSPAAKENVERGLKEFKAEGERLYRICRGNRNIVNVNETFECNGTAYYAMEYIEGGSLRGVVRSQGSGLREGVALSYIRPICEAVQYIHEEYGLLHCDIKPDNIMLRLDDDAQPREPVLIDFGISIHFNKKGEATTTRSSIGGVSPGYSPQEQYLGLDVIMETREKARREGLADLPPLPYEIDVYALGATLFYLLTGKDPDVASFSLDSLIDKRLQSAGVSDRMRTAVTSAMRQNSMSRTSTVRGFLQGFEERYSLPQGFILRGPHRSYQVVTGLMEEGSGFLRYEAVVYIPPVANSGGVPTKSQHFHLYECFDKSVHQRNRDESVGLKGHPTTTVFEAFHALMQSKTGLTATGEERAEGTIVHCDAFAANGTEYFVARHGYKPPVENFLTKMLASVGGLFGSKKKTTEQVSPSKIDTSAMPTVPSVIGRLMENMVFVEGGTFTMGATSEQGSDAYDEEKPAHQVTLSSYYIGKYEVTQEEWEAVMGNNPSAFKGSKRPVESVSWLDCQEFISKLNAMTGQTFRMPTEAEWEYAARGGNKSRGTKYAGGNDIDAVAWYNSFDNSILRTHPVGQKQPNELGLYDMSGNVWEWCNDWYDWKYYKSSPQTNPQGPSSGSDRVYRGGSWNSSAGYCRVSYREDDEPSFRYIFLGLRLARQFFP